MVRNRFFIILFMLLFLITGCSQKNDKNDSTVKKDDSSDVNLKSSNSHLDTSGSGSLKCTRVASASTGIDVSLNYELQYEDGVVLVLHSTEKITSSSSDSLDEYEEAYKKIAQNYDDLEYYDTNVIRTDDTVVNDTIINYQKLDMDKLLAIEGEEDNVIEDGKVKLATWLSFVEKFGTVCEEVK